MAAPSRTSSTVYTGSSEAPSTPPPEEEEETEETGQSWLLAHLSSLPIDEAAVSALVEGDISLFIRFQTMVDDVNRVLFVLVKKRRLEAPMEERPPPSEAEAPMTKAKQKAKRIMRPRVQEKEGEEGEERKGRNTDKKKKKKGRSLSKRGKGKSISPAKKKTTSQPPKRDSSSQRRHRQEAARVEIERDLLGVGPPLVSTAVTFLEFSDHRQIPDCHQFVVILPRSKALISPPSNLITPLQKLESEKNEFDQQYAVAFVRNRTNLDNSIRVCSMLLEKGLTPAGRMDLLLINTQIPERRLPKELLLEKYIIETVGVHFCVEGRRKGEGTEETRPLLILLSPVIVAFAQNPVSRPSMGPMVVEVEESVARVQLQTSLFDLQFLSDDNDLQWTAERLEHAVTQLRLLFLLFSTEAVEWTRRTFLYVLDLFSTMLAFHIMRKSALVCSTNPTENVGAICTAFEKFVLVARELSSILFDSAEDRAAADKLVFSFSVVEVLEEEIDDLVELVRSLHDERRDMAMDRTALDEAEGIITEVATYLEENCLASVVESGSLEALRTIAIAVVAFTKRLRKTIPPLPDS